MGGIGRGRRILVVEDNPKNLKLVTDLLTYRGHEVLTAGDGESGIDTAIREIPDLILMDLQLPGLDGLSATERIKADERTARIPVLAVTAHALREDSRRIRQAGCDGYVTKPIRTREFIRVVEEALKIDSISVAGEPAERKKPAEGPPPGTAKGTVLVVDDEERNRRLIEATLAPLGYELIHSPSGEEALARIEKVRPDLVLLDIMMPGMDGIEVTKRVRANPETSHIPIILLTAFADAERRLKGIEAGCDDFVAKPFDRLELTARIRSLLKISFYRTQMANSRKFDIVFEEAGDGVVIMDGEWKVEAANEVARRLLELPDPRPADFRLIDHLYRALDISVELRKLRDPGRRETRFEIRRPETESLRPLVLESTVKKILGPEGTVATVVLTIKDITGRWTEDRLKEDFLSGVSHKLKTPLAVIMANNEGLMNEYLGPIAPDQREAIQDMQIAARNLLSHVNKLLAFTSPDSFQHGSWAREPLVSFLSNYLERLKIQYESEAVTFALRIGDDVADLLVTPLPVTVALDNLAENAVKFRGNGPVLVHIGARRVSEGWVEISVEDNGPGIPAEYHRTIFEKFYQLEKYHTGRVAGAGLGLSLTKRVIEGLGGTIRVQSRLGEGATFSFTVPATRGADLEA
ncbi:MAG: response regulator [Candidatus Eisenbacteria bacterium]